jgi:hypothetical protein
MIYGNHSWIDAPLRSISGVDAAFAVRPSLSLAMQYNGE